VALNPVVLTETVVRSSLRYRFTACPIADERLHAQAHRRRIALALDRRPHG
jgi:hypothetical protein